MEPGEEIGKNESMRALFERSESESKRNSYDALKTVREAIDDGSLQVRDFAFPPDDVRHKGHGSVIPAKEGETKPEKALVVYDFVAESQNEMSVAIGQQVQVLQVLDSGWVVAQDSANKGLVPKAYLQLDE